MRRLIFVVVAVAALAAAVAGIYYARVDEKYQGYPGNERFVEIAPGTGSRAIGKALVDAGVVRDEWTFRLAVFLTGTQRELKAGEYRFTTPASAKDVARKLARGDVFLRPITFPEGLSLKEMASIYQSRGLGQATAFLEAAKDTSAVKALDPQARDLEGYLFPDTYNVPRKMSADALVRQMVHAFLRIYGETIQKDVEARGGTLREVVTLASIVEKEAAKRDERPVVAAVYQNRLRIGMGLQCDPTVIYALEKAGRYAGNLTKADLKFDSPYNTYKYAGLPPGPIASPGRASLEAAAQPASVDYLYFVSRNDGTHVFATTLAEHNRNVKEWQKDFFKEKKPGL
jgi:peptidoglycan lytic transglycosylase G